MITKPVINDGMQLINAITKVDEGKNDNYEVHELWGEIAANEHDKKEEGSDFLVIVENDTVVFSWHEQLVVVKHWHIVVGVLANEVELKKSNLSVKAELTEIMPINEAVIAVEQPIIREPITTKLDKGD